MHALTLVFPQSSATICRFIINFRGQNTDPAIITGVGENSRYDIGIHERDQYITVFPSVCRGKLPWH